MDTVQKDGFDFVFDPSACEACAGFCCCGNSGNVWVSPQEVELICLFLKMNFVDFAAKYLRRVGNRFSFQERMVAEAFECIFFDGIEKKCSIYALRPSGCQTYPFWDYFKIHPEQVARECPGIRGRKLSEIVPNHG
ncbi:MAG: YkgJ family cysteine cluster protein [Desulfobulbaceae bacterium]|jgi:hypothetical protein|nr:YkgJ family cysteine cluster protein [Desulfobulbaceae bacterium]